MLVLCKAFLNSRKQSLVNDLRINCRAKPFAKIELARVFGIVQPFFKRSESERLSTATQALCVQGGCNFLFVLAVGVLVKDITDDFGFFFVNSYFVDSAFFAFALSLKKTAFFSKMFCLAVSRYVLSIRPRERRLFCWSSIS